MPPHYRSLCPRLCYIETMLPSVYLLYTVSLHPLHCTVQTTERYQTMTTVHNVSIEYLQFNENCLFMSKDTFPLMRICQQWAFHQLRPTVKWTNSKLELSDPVRLGKSEVNRRMETLRSDAIWDVLFVGNGKLIIENQMYVTYKLTSARLGFCFAVSSKVEPFLSPQYSHYNGIQYQFELRLKENYIKRMPIKNRPRISCDPFTYLPGVLLVQSQLYYLIGFLRQLTF